MYFLFTLKQNYKKKTKNVFHKVYAAIDLKCWKMQIKIF